MPRVSSRPDPLPLLTVLIATASLASGLPRADIDGRGVLRFSVDGVPRPYRFEELPTLDLVILYESGREPMALAPIDLDPSVLERYFAGEP